VEGGIDWVRALCTELNISSLRAWGISEADLPDVVKKAARASSTQINPFLLTEDELRAVVTAAT
jgi:alcohol dehydrogenase class IV